MRDTLRRMRFGWIVAAAVVAVVVLGGGAVAQEVGGLFFDTVDVRLVNVEVLVTDKDGNAVTDLTVDEFEVFEDGRRVEVTNFFAVEDRKVKQADDDVAAGRVAEQFFYAPETRRLNLILFVDNLNMRPENRNAVFHAVAEYMRERLDPRDRVMVVSLGRQLEIVGLVLIRDRNPWRPGGVLTKFIQDDVSHVTTTHYGFRKHKIALALNEFEFADGTHSITVR